jgi:hypothetical protein
LRIFSRSSAVKITILALGLLLLFTSIGLVPTPRVAAQKQFVTATPGYVNLGMNSTIEVTGLTGNYNIIVQNPTGGKFELADNTAGQSWNATFGSARSDFDGVVNETGTYNVFVEESNSSTVISSSSFYATNKLLVSMTVVNSGTCIYVQGVDRGVKIFPRYFVSYASNGAQVTNSDKGISVMFTLPNGSLSSAGWDPFAKEFVGGVFPNWNYSNIVANWRPNATITDAAGNAARFNYTSSPFYIEPATLNTIVTVVNAATNQTLSGLTNGTRLTVRAVVSYPTNAEPVAGFVAPLDSVNRGGSVTALIGWGYYNATSGAFGGGKTTGGNIAHLTLSYTGSGGLWEANYTASSIPGLVSGTSYEVVVNAKDSAPIAPNTGFATAILGSVAASTTSTTSTTTAAITSNITLWTYAGTTIALIIGVIVGFLARRPGKEK